MVALTVIMAAIVASFVFGVISTPKPTPQASITVNDYLTETPNPNGSIELLHRSGETLSLADLRIVVSNDSTELTFTFQESSEAEWDAGEMLILSNVSFARQFTNPNFNLAKDSTYEIRIIHKPSGNIISKPTLSTN